VGVSLNDVNPCVAQMKRKADHSKLTLFISIYLPGLAVNN